MKFGAFLAPHHPIGEHPTLQFRADLDFAAQLDALGYDEFWCGEHHSTGWEVIASPEMFLAAAGERTHRIRLGTGVVSLPYHHPFNVAQRIVQLDHMTGGRVIFGSGPGALPSDAYMLGIDPMVQRDRQDEAIGVIKRLFAGDRVTHESDWFTLRDARLQLMPLQEDLPFAVASQVSPSGMTLAGKYGAGVLSIGSMSTAGLMALPTQWSFAEDAAAKAGRKVDRANWRVVMSWHIAETRDEARAQARDGLLRWHNEYNVGTLMRPGSVPFGSPDEAVDQTAFADGAASVIGTPDDLVAAIRRLMELSGGFGTVIGFAHDWANRENTRRSWDLVARHVIPEVNGMLDAYRESRRYVIEHRESFERAGAAVMQKIMGNERAAAALKETLTGRTATTGGHTPDLQAEKAKAETKGEVGAEPEGFKWR
jgi:limonene 1,2-monooxygenase